MRASYHSLKLSFSLQIEGEKHELFFLADLFLPSIVPKAILVAWPGGSFTRRYFHLEVPGFPYDAYSFGLEMSRRGYLVIAFDHLGIGEGSSGIADTSLTLPVLAEANACVVAHIRQKLRNGTLHSDLAPIEAASVVAVGHSLGAQLAIIEQAQNQSYDALILLGWANQMMTLAGAEQDLAQYVENTYEKQGSGAMIQEAIATKQEVSLMELRSSLRPLFYNRDVPQEVIDADEALAIKIPRGVAVHANNPAFMAAHAAKIHVPLFLGNGTIDIARVFYAEPAYYLNCKDITLFELSGSNHCHFFSPMRGKLYSRLDAWFALYRVS